MPDQVLFAQAFGADGYITHHEATFAWEGNSFIEADWGDFSDGTLATGTTSTCGLNQICECALGLSEDADAEPKEESDNAQTG